MKLLLVFFCQLMVIMSIGQNISISATIYAAREKMPISYANIHIVNTNRYFDADKDGKFSASLNRTDSVLISCLGYVPVQVPATVFVNSNSIYLNEIVYALGAVEVTNSVPKEIGFVNEKQTRSIVGESLSDSYEVATRMTVPDIKDSFRIQKVIFRQKNFSADRILQLRLYAVAESGLPGTELLKKQVLLSENDFKDGQLVIDIRDQNIILGTKSFFVGLQWITGSTPLLVNGRKNDIGIGETSVLPEKLTYRRGRILNHKWYLEYEKGILVPSTISGTADTLLGVTKGNPINILSSVIISPI